MYPMYLHTKNHNTNSAGWCNKRPTSYTQKFMFNRCLGLLSVGSERLCRYSCCLSTPVVRRDDPDVAYKSPIITALQVNGVSIRPYQLSRRKRAAHVKRFFNDHSKLLLCHTQLCVVHILLFIVFVHCLLKNSPLFYVGIEWLRTDIQSHKALWISIIADSFI